MPSLFRQLGSRRKWRRAKATQSTSKRIEDHELVTEITTFLSSEVRAGGLG
ncbi:MULTISPECIES: hypothetical protein [unclassified Brevibacterium]|uniref:hypothetical protein n=1 Tax=unclassified Brevibacterium TaxID=2614124 RepID=UPI0018684134|nr:MULTISPECIES: hypothetical protein [unclassified Brevibacterium]